MMTPWLGPYKTSLKVLYSLAGALPYKACAIKPVLGIC
jgi:hypothetical protein